jgi:thioredoxin 2
VNAVVPCAFCSTLNRVHLGRLRDGPRCAECHRPILLDRPIRVDDASFERVIRDSDVPVLVDFYADWCGPCRMMAPTMDEFAASHAGRVLVAKLDTEQSPHTPRRFDIRGIPTVIAFHQGREVGRHVGLAGTEMLERLAGVR